MDGSKEVSGGGASGRGKGGGGGGGDKKPRKFQNQTKARGGGACRGFLYYSSVLKSNGTDPRCIGIPRTVAKVPDDIIGAFEVVASERESIHKDFYYACAGRSAYLSVDQSTDKPATKTQLPICVGLEFLKTQNVAILRDGRAPAAGRASTPAQVRSKERTISRDGRVPTAGSMSAPAQINSKEDGQELPQAQAHKPADSAVDDFLKRYTRNLGLVASGAAKNMLKMGNYIKESMVDIVFPDRRRPK